MEKIGNSTSSGGCLDKVNADFRRTGTGCADFIVSKKRRLQDDFHYHAFPSGISLDYFMDIRRVVGITLLFQKGEIGHHIHGAQSVASSVERILNLKNLGCGRNDSERKRRGNPRGYPASIQKFCD